MGSNRINNSYAFYRSKKVLNQGKLIGLFYPEGFAPMIHLNVKDRSADVGVKGFLPSGMSWDLSYDYGKNLSAYETRNSINVTLGDKSPLSFYDGAMANTQHVVNADISKPLTGAMSTPRNFSWEQNIVVSNGKRCLDLQYPIKHKDLVGSMHSMQIKRPVTTTLFIPV